MKQIDYQSYLQETESFQPSRLNKDLSGFDRNTERMSAAEQRNAQMIQLNNNIRERNEVNASRALSELSELSQTLFSITSEVVKRNIQDQQISETYDALVGDYEPDQDVEDAESEKTELALTSQTNETASTLEADGEPGAAQLVRNQSPAGIVANANLSERGRLMRAQTSYAPWMSNFLRSDAKFKIGGQTITVAQAMNSGDSALMSAAQGFARARFIGEFGLQNVSKRRFVKSLKGTILNADASIASGFMAESLKAQRKENQRVLNEQGFSLGASGENLGVGYRDLADRMYTSGAFATRSEANQAALKSTLSGLIAKGDVEGVRELFNENKIEGNNGTKLGKEYGSVFMEAETQAQKQRDGIFEQNAKDITAQMYNDLSQLGESATPEQRAEIVERAALDLELNGNAKEARDLRSKLDSLTVDQSNDLNFSRLLNGIDDGSVTSAEQIRRARLVGDISLSQERSLLSRFGDSRSSKTPKDEEAKGVVLDWSKRFNSDFLTAFGLKTDQSGNIIDDGKKSPFTPGEAKVIVGQMKRDLNIAVNTVLSQNPGVTGLAKSQLIQEAVRDWWSRNVQARDGKYYFQDVVEAGSDASKVFGEGKAQIQNDAAKRLKRIITDPNAAIMQRMPISTSPIDLSAYTTSGKPIEDWAVRIFNALRGDTVFSKPVLVEIRESWRQGKVDPRLTRYAKQLNMSPLGLLNQQSGVYGLGGFDPSRSTARGSQSSSVDSSVAPQSGISGANYLMTLGFPKKGAAYLAGNIQQESSWYGQREPWDDGGSPAGGVVSWRAGRLRAIESFYGKPISRISNNDQLSYMLREMKANYPQAYAVFMNPYATNRQLEAASYQYWGYGTEGARFKYAQQYLNQM